MVFRHLSALLAVVAAACGGDVRTISLERLAPAADPDCGAPLDARTLRVAAVGDFSNSDATARSVEIGLGEGLSIEAFPETTRALEVEVLGAGGALRAVGRTEAFDPGELSDGDRIRVFMAPPNGHCPTGPPARSRSGALAAPTGDDVVILGGVDSSGAPVLRPEIYLGREARFEEIPQTLYGELTDGLAGASITPLSDGRLVLAGGALNAFQIYSPETQRFSEPPNLLSQARAFHAAVALDDRRIFFAGGCSRVLAGVCEADTESATTAILDVDSGDLRPGPPLSSVRVSPQAFLEPDGRVIVVGGSDATGPVLTAERIDPLGNTASEILAGVGHVGARLESGAVITAFGPDSAPSGLGSAYAPSGTTSEPLVPAATRASPTMTALETGQVLAYGGSVSGASEAALFAPLGGRWDEVDMVATDQRRRHAAARLPDGSVLIVGGETSGGAHLGDALIFRPDLLGPLTGSLAINFFDESGEQLIPRDRASSRRVDASGDTPPHLEILARALDEGVPGEWAVVAAPVLERSQIELTATSSGFGIMTGFVEPTTYRVILVAADAAVRLVDLVGNNITAVSGCSGEIVSADELARDLRWTLNTGESSTTLRVGEREVFSCDVEPVRSGRVGVGALGPSGAPMRLFQLSVSR